MRDGSELLARGMATTGWSIDLLCAAHWLVVREARGADRFHGRVRRAQNWIGDSLQSASYVPPPGDLIKGELTDLVRFMRGPSMFAPPITAALAFAQLLAIHPFNDGNGRLGRALALAILGSDGVPADLPLNRQLRLHRAAHLRAIEGVTRRGEWEEWIAFFLRAVADSTRI